MASSTLKVLLEKHEGRVLAEWQKSLAASLPSGKGRIGRPSWPSRPSKSSS